MSPDRTSVLASDPAPQAPDATRLSRTRDGVFVAVAGPSGAGKDSLINYARVALAGDQRFVFVKRVVTRPADVSEDHDSLSPADFRFRADTGAYALWWEANGLHYGLPATVLADLAGGRVAVSNISRDVISRVRERFARSLIIHVTASVDVLSKRLASRGREGESDQLERLSRSLLREQTVEADVRIENNGDLADAGRRFTSILQALAVPVTP